MIMNMVQIVQAAFANMLHTSTTIRIPLPRLLSNFLGILSCTGGANSATTAHDTKSHDRSHDPYCKNGCPNEPKKKRRRVILTEQGNYIARMNNSEKDQMEMDNYADRNRNLDEEAAESDKMLQGDNCDADGKPDYTDDWKKFFLCLDRICFLVMVALLTIVFFTMMYYQ